MAKRKSRREYGSGSVYQRCSKKRGCPDLVDGERPEHRCKGLWTGTIEAGWTSEGTRRRIPVSATTREEAQRRLRDRRRELELHGASNANPRDTVKKWAEEWLAIVERKQAPNTFRTSRTGVQRWIIPTIGHKRFDALTPADVRAVGTAIRKAGYKSGTQLRHHATLMTMLTAAQLEGYPVPPRLFAVDRPSKGTNDRTALAPAQAYAFLEHAGKLDHGSRWYAAMLQGVRQGEALGLTWDQVDLEAGLLEISWQLQPLSYNVRYDRTSGFRVPDDYEARQVSGRWHLVRPKSRAGWRVVPFVPGMREALETWREIAPPNEHNLVWPAADGRHRDPKDDDAELYALEEEANVTHPTRARFTIHEARHTAATLLLLAGVDPVVVTKILGHSTVLTSRGYQHADAEQARVALERVTKMLTEKA